MPSSPAKRRQQYLRRKNRDAAERAKHQKITQAQAEREIRREMKVLHVPYETKNRQVMFSDEQWEFCKAQQYGASHFLRKIVDQYRHGEFPSSGGLYWYMENEILPRIEKTGEKDIAADLKKFLVSWKNSNSQWGLRHEF